MPRKPSENTTQIALRIPDAWLEKSDDLIPWLSRQGIGVTRTDVIRAAITRGLHALAEDRSEDEQMRKAVEKQKRGKGAIADFIPPPRTRR